MGAVRHRQLIQVLAAFVALDMAVGIVALSARRGRKAVQTTLVAGPVGIPLNDTTGTGILAGANLSDRRVSGDGSGASGSLEAAPTTQPANPSGAAGTAGAIPAAPVSAATASTAARHGATASTSAPGVTATAARPSATTVPTTRSPGTTATTRRAPVPSTTAETRRPATNAPAGGGTTAATSPPPAPNQPRTELVLTDRTGDTVADGSQKTIKEPRADIIRTAAAYRPGVLVFGMQVQQPVDPRTDERWAADSTFATWSIDTTGDGKPDFDVQYYAVDGQVAGYVSKPGSTDSLCDIEAGYGSEGYAAFIDPACLGNPASISYRVTVFYDTNPKDDNADVATDVTPDGGMSFPVARPN